MRHQCISARALTLDTLTDEFRVISMDPAATTTISSPSHIYRRSLLALISPGFKPPTDQWALAGETLICLGLQGNKAMLQTESENERKLKRKTEREKRKERKGDYTYFSRLMCMLMTACYAYIASCFLKHRLLSPSSVDQP